MKEIKKLKTRHLLCIGDLSAREALGVLELTRRIKRYRRKGRKFQPLKGQCLAMIFSKSSTRTRISFETGIRQLGGYALFLSVNDIQLGRGETIADTARVLSRYVDGIMIRTYSHQDAVALAAASDVPVINGLTDLLHPCQVLADLFTISELRPVNRKLHVVYIGDGNNVANSWLTAAALLGFRLSFVSPERYRLKPEIFAHTGLDPERLPENIRLYDAIRPEAFQDAHIIYTDVWASMGQERERAERLEIFRPFQVNGELLKLAPEAKVMHCLPAHRGEEITDEVMDGEASIVVDQAENRLHLQKTLMYLLMSRR